jgi:hypothetical protein
MSSLKTKVTRLLTGASLTALSIAAVRTGAIAATQTITVPTDHVNITTNLTTFTNETTIGPGQNNPLFPLPPHAVTVDVTKNAVVSVINNTAHAVISAKATGYLGTHNGAVLTATALRIDGAAPTVNNFGEIKAFASANNLHSGNSAVASAKAHGFENISPNSQSAVTNSGQIAATALAHATAVAPAATAYASAVGMHQSVTGKDTGPALAAVVNTGQIEAFANAVATGTSGDAAFAFAHAAGIHQLVANATQGSAFLSNPAGASIPVVAHAHAFATGGGDASARAGATGVSQTVNAFKGIATVNNFGKIEAFASAVATATLANARANAEAIGVFQRIEAETASGGPGFSGIATVKNSGDIEGFATARAFAPGTAAATAHGTGVEQLMAFVGSAIFSKVGSGIASAVVVNSGLIEGFAKAQAGGFLTHAGFFVAADSAFAHATAHGVSQNVVDNANSFLNVTNSGHILATAYALATATHFASAGAHALGVFQFVGAEMQAVATVHNSASGLIQALAVADATAADAKANATATGVRQVLSITPLAKATVSNTGANAVIRGQASATAHGDPSGHASAHAVAAGVVQTEVGVNAAFETVTNDGHITAKANAIAIANSGNAHATASGIGVRQFGDSNTAFTALVTNDSTGVIAGSAYADAVAKFFATAKAFATGVRQIATGSTDNAASLNVTNSGHIQGKATALAISTRSFASAEAAAFGVAQAAEDVTVVVGVVTNAGSIQAVAKAAAEAHSSALFGLFADATARATGVGQKATDVVTADFTVGNAGHIDAQASAYATSLDDVAFAHAHAAGVFQRGTDVFGALMAIVTNAATAQIGGFARATAAAEGHASANAYGVGVSQYALEVLSADFTVENSGTIAGQAAAHASSLFGDGSARATALGVTQFGSEDGAITALVINGSSGHIEGLARATAVAPVFATANASAFGVAQTGNHVEAATFTVNNAGHINALAIAFASSYSSGAHAEAIADGVHQAATPLNGGSGAFTATVTNSGDIGALAKATALARSSATARATAVGVSQVAEGFGVASFSVTNSANIVAEATAYAHSTEYDSASADAFAAGVIQAGLGVGSMVAVVNNSGVAGSIAAFAKAKASAHSSAYAEASAYGVLQAAEEVGLATFTVNNTGSIRALATANAVADIFASADARAHGVQQIGEGVGIFTATVNNSSGGILAAAAAKAVAGSTASAFAFAIGVAQTAEEVGVANFTVNNGGSIRAVATAVASGAGANATAVAFGVEQLFEAVGLPKATVDNSGLIDVRANALANGGTHASASANAFGIAVEAAGVPFLTVNITNSGSIRAVASATAAHATATNYAVANAVGIFAAATEVITGTIANHGIIHASAFAAGTSGYAHAVGIWDPSLLNNTHIINTGLINAYAQATGGPVAHATGILISGVTELASAAPVGQQPVSTPSDPNGITFKTDNQ